MTATKAITHVLFTYSWNGFAIRFDDGTQETHTADSLMREYGEEEYQRIWKTAYHNGWTGMWYEYKGN